MRGMNGSDILRRLADAIMARSWHWYRYHAENFFNDIVTPFFMELMTALAVVDGRMPGSANALIARIGSIGGRFKDQADYDQLYQILAEIDVMLRVCSFHWGPGAVFEYEPSIVAGGTNPEMIVTCNRDALAIEVKAPLIRQHRASMGEGWQATARGLDPEAMEFSMLPRDNPIKEAVAGADAKFADMRTVRPEALSVLIVLWDELMNEVIAALANPASGLFTPNTFDPKKRPFSNVDAVVILPHAHQLIEGPGNRNFIDSGTTFGWPRFPFKPFILNPASPRVGRISEMLQEVFDAEDQRGLLGAEYGASDAVLWINSRGPEAANESEVDISSAGDAN